MKVGDELTLVMFLKTNVETYSDQFGIRHKCNVIYTYYNIKITDIKKIPGQWDVTRQHDVYKAVSIDNKYKFGCGWNMESYDDSSMYPSTNWYILGDKDENLYFNDPSYKLLDLYWAFQFYFPVVDVNRNLFVPEGYNYCSIHRYLNKKDDMCIQCSMENNSAENYIYAIENAKV